MTRSFDPRPLAEVQAVPDGDRWVLNLVRDLRHPPETVWRALVEPSQLGAWAPWTADRPLDSPGPVTLTMIDGEARVDLPGEVLVARPPELLEYTIGPDTVRWQLSPATAGTRLTLRHSVPGPDWLTKVAAGWHICLAVAEHLLDGDPVGPITGRQALEHGFADLQDGYATALGMTADTPERRCRRSPSRSHLEMEPDHGA
jgi:uncharacterized protein YndB with AHSA1/START domain